jgi:DNA-binding winged helix-turn-helix (wHTH) protein/tetratricopeptide (TPR) repeat protein
MIKQGQHLYDFGPFRFDPSERLLTRDGQPVALTPRAFEALTVFIRNSGHLVAKEELMKAIWGEAFVEPGNLVVTISMLRKALGEEGGKYIQTVSKLGYRFVGEVREAAPVESEPVARQASGRFPGWAGRAALFGGCLLLLAVSVALGVVPGRFRSHASTAVVRSVAVLPFRNLSGDSATDDLAMRLTESVIRKLGATQEVTVREASAAVDAVLEGRVQASPERLLVTVQLLRVADRTCLWSGSFDQNPKYISTLDGTISEHVVRTIARQGKLPSQSSSANKRAYQLYLYGRHFWSQRTTEGLKRSMQYFHEALAEDPGYAPAYAGLADSYTLLSSLGPVETAPAHVRTAALRALQLDASSADAHATLGLASLFFDRNWNEAEREFRTAITLDPNNATARQRYGLALAAMGRMGESLDQMRRAAESDPLSLIVNADVGWILYLSRRYDEAIAVYRKVLDLDPHFVPAHTFLGLAYIQKGAFEAAIEEFQAARKLGGENPYLTGMLGYARGRGGDGAAAREALSALSSRSQREYVPPFSFALVCIGLGQNDQAIKWLAEAYKEHNKTTVYARSDPALDPLRSDRRFTELLGRMGF